MNKQISSNIFSFIFFTLVQVFFFLNFNLYEWGFAFVYIGFVLFLPFYLPTTLVLVLAFAQGLTIDLFYDTLGTHAASLVLLAYLRPVLSKLLIPKMVDSVTSLKSVSELGNQRMTALIVMLTFVHHIFLFLLINSGSSYFWSNILQALISTIITSFVLFSLKIIFFKKL